MTILTKQSKIKYDSIGIEQHGVIFRFVFMKGSHVLFTTDWTGIGNCNTLVLKGIKGKLKLEVI